MAAHYQHKHNHHYVPDGLRHSKHAKPSQAKLDELIRVSAARNTLIGIETLTQDEIADIRATRPPNARRAVKGVAGRHRMPRGDIGKSAASVVAGGGAQPRFRCPKSKMCAFQLSSNA